jgi:DNA-binding FadR family transcriptional regulator
VPRDDHKANDEAPAPALTDQAMVKIKDLILTGEFQAGSKLPPERDLAAKLGLSRNSLRELEQLERNPSAMKILVDCRA